MFRTRSLAKERIHHKIPFSSLFLRGLKSGSTSRREIMLFIGNPKRRSMMISNYIQNMIMQEKVAHPYRALSLSSFFR